MTNVSAASVGDLWLAAVNTSLGLPIDLKRSEEPYYNASLDDLRRFEGHYQSAEGGNLTIALKEGIPTAEADGQQFDLRVSDPQTLVIKEKERPIRFYFEGDQPAWAALFGSRMLTRDN